MRLVQPCFFFFFMLMLLTAASSPSTAQPQAYEAYEDEFRPGLIGQYRAGSGDPVEQVDRRIAFAWAAPAAQEHRGEHAGPGFDAGFDVTWRGYLMSQTPGTYRLYALVAGDLRLSLDGEVVLRAQSAEPSWHASEPLEIPFDFHPLEIDYRNSGDGRLALFWSGPQFQLEPIGTGQFYHDPSEPPAQRFQQGRQLVRALRCEACHEIPGHSQALAAPALDHLTGNLHREWLVDRLAGGQAEDEAQGHDPAQSGRRMPHFALSRGEAEDIAAFLYSQSETTDWQPPQPKSAKSSGSKNKGKKEKVDPFEAGEELFLTVGCVACHQLEDLGSNSLFDGGDLTQVAAKRPGEFFERWLHAPERINADHHMPVFDLTAAERSHLAAFLSGQGKPKASDAADEVTPGEAQIERGRALVGQHRCTSCHAVSEEANVERVAPAALEDLEAASTCLDSPTQRHPGYRLAEPQREAVLEFLEHAGSDAASVAEVRGEQILAEHNCLNCHARGPVAGIAEELTEVASQHERLAPLVPAMTPPSLDYVGDKMHQAALKKAIRREGEPHRDYLRVRMPSFPLSDAELNTLVDYFVHSDRIPPEGAEETTGESPADIDPAALEAIGSRLVTPDGFGCTSCHQLGDVEPSEAPLNALGPDLSMLGQRIRRPWFDRFVRNPPRIIPRMEMPSVRVAVTGVLDDDLDKQLDAVWEVMNEPGFQPPEPDPVRVVRRSGAADHDERAVAVTDVVRTDESTFVKPLLIGLPNRHNMLFDLETARLARWSIGDTARQRTEGKYWYWEAAGNPVFQNQAEEAELALEIGGTWHQPAVTGQYPTEFDVLRHIDQGIAFEHRLEFHSGGDAAEMIQVNQRFAAAPQPSDQETGVRREVLVERAPPDSQIRLQLVSSAQAAQATRSGDERQFTVAEGRARIRLREPAGAVFREDGSVVVPVSEDEGEARLVVDYLTELPVDHFPLTPTEEEPVESVRLNVVPGFEAIRLPLTETLMPTALDWHPDGDLFVASLKGRVWRARDTDGDALEDVIRPFSDELAAPYGLAVYDDYVDVSNKYALLRLFDQDGDGRTDRTVAIASGWGHTIDYHDWAIGLPRDEQGCYYLGLPCQQDDRSPEGANLRGTVVKLVPRSPSGEDPRLFDVEQISAGHRFPMGIDRNASGDLFVTDNQGNYNPFNELNHVQQDAHFGFINSLEREPGFDPPLTAPAIDIPHPWTRSVNGICFIKTPDTAREELGRSAFGPFEGHLIGCEYDTRRLIRMSLEKVGSTYQGAAYPFSYEEPPTGPPLLGPLVCAVAPDGDLYVGGIRDSGWGGANNVGEIVRLKMRSDELPCGIAEVRATPTGFTIRFTRPVDAERASQAASYSISSYTRVSTPAYGGDDKDRRTERVGSVQLSEDLREATIDLGQLRADYVYEIRLRNLAGEGEAFFPAEAHYTMRVIPGAADNAQAESSQ